MALCGLPARMARRRIEWQAIATPDHGTLTAFGDSDTARCVPAPGRDAVGHPGCTAAARSLERPGDGHLRARDPAHVPHVALRRQGSPGPAPARGAPAGRGPACAAERPGRAAARPG